MAIRNRYDDDLRLAHVIADQVDSLTMSRFKAQDLEVHTKPDLTEVSDADLAAERLIRAQLGRTRQRDVVQGEEFETTGTGDRRWIIDPIDGTKNYVRGVPVWATLIGLADGDQMVMGLVSAPALGRRWWASLGTGAWTGRSLAAAQQIRVSQVSKLEHASFSYSSFAGWEERGKLDAFMDLSRKVWRTRAYGDFWSHMLVAEGAVDFSAEPELALHDMAALVAIVTEAGGRFTSLDGRNGPWGGNALVSNNWLHEEVLARLGDSDDAHRGPGGSDGVVVSGRFPSHGDG